MSDRNHPSHASNPSKPANQGVFSGARTRHGAQRLQQIADELHANRAETAEKNLSEYLGEFPDDTDAIVLMARVLDRRGRTAEAVSLLSRCLKLAPDFAAARFICGRLLFRLHRYREALAEVEQLLKQDERNPRYRELKAGILAKIGDEKEAREIWRGLVSENPRRAEFWVLYGATLRSMGVHEESVAAYRQAIECRRSCGLAWSSLADTKGFRFGDTEILSMLDQLSRPDLSPDDRTYFLFALARAHEDRNDYQRAFELYAKANAAPRTDRGEHAAKSRASRIKALFTPEFLRNRKVSGCKAPDPIFLLGRPRSGSTLVEQILASHSAIEGAGELPYIGGLVRQLNDRECRLLAVEYPEVLETLEGAALAGLGDSYLESAAVHRKTGRPYFVDKMPGNFLHIGMIQLVLPNSKIIDIRRNPAATCLSMFKHNLGKANVPLEELGRLYREYVEFMAHFDRVLPGRIHRVIYEELVANPEAEIRNLLQYLGLPFEESCLRFYATDRAIRTPSSEQVRRPMFADAVDHWRRFEPWLAPLTESLGSVLTKYPSVPGELC
jgi:tetratricopeptide (TPR) repeat protein